MGNVEQLCKEHLSGAEALLQPQLHHHPVGDGTGIRVWWTSPYHDHHVAQQYHNAIQLRRWRSDRRSRGRQQQKKEKEEAI